MHRRRSDLPHVTPTYGTSSPSLPAQRRRFSTSSMLPPTLSRNMSRSEHAMSTAELPEDEWQVESKEDHMDFFQKGRDYQPEKAKHKFTEEEKHIMASFENAALQPSHTALFRHHLASVQTNTVCHSWPVIALIAVIIGTLTFIMKMICERLQIFYNPFVQILTEDAHTIRLWLYYTGVSCLCGTIAVSVIVFLCPPAAGSGVPEIIGVLNGCVVRNVLGMRPLICKTISCVFTVVSSLPVGFEGPMIHIGGMVGALMTSPCRICKSDACEHMCDGRCCGKICRYRDCQQRHNFICAGAAAGVASAFSSPITGLCFAMEELSTYWTKTLTWQTFVCCILSRSTTELLRSITSTVERSRQSSENGSHFNGSHFSRLELSEAALFDMKVPLKMNLLVFIPTLIIGVLGGLLGALYIFMYLKMAKVRRRLLNKFRGMRLANLYKIVEVFVLCFVSSSLVMASMNTFYCNRVNHTEPVSSDDEIHHMVLRNYNCPQQLKTTFEKDSSVIHYEGEFHEGATLLLGSYEQMIRNLLSRKTSDFFSITCLSFIFLFFFLFSCWSALVSISGGVLIPQLAIGALYGRLLGKCIHELLKDYISINDPASELDFVDPGGLALIGAASFFAGSSRLTITSVILIAEMTNDINMSLLVMVAVMLAKFIGDGFTHSFFHSLLEFKCIPFLDPELKIYHNDVKIDLELFPVSLVMAKPVQTISLHASVSSLANLLLESSHGAFPVVKPINGNSPIKSVFVGLISRMELTILLTRTKAFDVNELSREDADKICMACPEYTSTKLKECVKTNNILQQYAEDTAYEQIMINLYPYINLSSHSVPTTFSLHRSYIVFRDLGLRHLVVVDENNEVQGIVTRKDLLGFVVEEKINEEIALLRRRSVYEELQEASRRNRNRTVDTIVRKRSETPVHLSGSDVSGPNQ